MDPLSATVSTIALNALYRKLLQGLKILRQLSTIPEEMEALVDKVSIFQDILSTKLNAYLRPLQAIAA